MNIRTVVVGDFQVNCYVVSDATRHALVIDPGADAADIAEIIQRDKLTVDAYLITHGHIDHVSGLADLLRQFPAPVAMHPDDAKWAFTRANQMLPFYPAPERPPAIARSLADGQTWEDGANHYRVLGTPGHSPGSVCFYFAEAYAVFTGDTLFAGSVGRTDFAGGSERLLAQSLRLLTDLPEGTAVYPGHGPTSTIGQEKATNPFLVK